MSNHLFSWLLAGTPVWLSLCLLAACGGLAWQHYKAVQRLDRHARSIAHMDDWADSVDHTLAQIEERGRRPYPPAVPPRTADLRKTWQK